MWSDAVVKDAFKVAFKNAVEAAWDNKKEEGLVTIQLQASPRDLEKDQVQWFLDVVIENTGEPIPESKLKELNAPDPAPISKSNKSGSTGIGVFVSRYQLKEVIRMGADLVLSNAGENWVQSRIRLPAELVVTEHEEPRREPALPEKEYLLYVEDYADIYKDAINVMKERMREYGLELVHKKGYGADARPPSGGSWTTSAASARP